MNRRDGIRVKNLDAMHVLMPYIKPNRCDSDVFINQLLDVTELVKYMNNLKKKEKDITYFHLFMTLIAKTIYNKPLLNRFVVNKRFYDRKDVSIAFTAKVNYEDKAKEILSVIKIEENDNLFSIKEKTLKAVENIRNAKESGTNNSMNIIAKLPGFILSPVVGIIKWMDRHDLLPKSLIDDNLYYSTCIVSNLGSIKSGAIYHNLTDFGTSSILATIGEIKEQYVLIDGKQEKRYLCEFGINIDERIADGVYFVKAVKLMQDILNKPESLEENVNEKIRETTKLKY